MRKGQATKRTLAMQAIADEALKSGTSPLEVLLDNMRFYQSKIQMAEQMLADAIANKETPTALIDVLQRLCNFRSEAGRFAVDAAPYVHPRRATVEINAEINNTFELRTIHEAESFTRQIAGLAARDSTTESLEGIER